VTVEPRAVYSQLALADLEELEIFIADRDGQLRAEGALAHIKARVRNLAFMPRMGRATRGTEPGTRASPIRPWIIYYDPLPGGGIHVHRIVDGRRDLRAVFAPPTPK
jgi:plasmid stabilization system protein ParE